MASCHFGSVEAEGAMGIGGLAILGFLVVFRAPYIVDISFSIEKIIVLQKVRIKKNKSK